MRQFASFLIAATMAWAAETGEIRLVAMADDMGVAHGINAGTIRAYREGIVRSTNVIVPGPWLLDAVAQLRENPGLDCGIHLALTSEWEFVKWRPLTHAPSLVDENGYFFPMTRKIAHFPPRSSVEEAGVRPDEVERELRAQIETMRRLLPRVTFVTSHMGAATSTPALRAIVEKLAGELGLPPTGSVPEVRSLGRMYRQTDSGEEKAQALTARLAEIGPGTWSMIDHAALDTEEVRAIGHLGYRNVAADRSGNVACWTSPVVKEVVRKRKIRLVSWGELIREHRARK
ncbi:MAG: carbohydrate deacetylase [Bryobacteraceae bacterium]